MMFVQMMFDLVGIVLMGGKTVSDVPAALGPALPTPSGGSVAGVVERSNFLTTLML